MCVCMGGGGGASVLSENNASFYIFRAAWSCVQCKTEYDLSEIEQNLVDAINRKSMAYVLQDLTCVKCHQVWYQSRTD